MIEMVTQDPTWPRVAATPIHPLVRRVTDEFKPHNFISTTSPTDLWYLSKFVV
jgi:hypothetical protein